MSSKQILALSSSRVGNEAYLETAVHFIRNFLGEYPFTIAFIPFALVSKQYNQYTATVIEALGALPYTIPAINDANANDIIEQSDVIMVGGGNTFKLLHDIYRLKIFDIICSKINAGTPYIGWSAGANIASPTISTTNDMPIIQPENFRALGFFPFQINPHYYNQQFTGFNGETRNQRLLEFIQLNPASRIIGLPEGTALQLRAGELKFLGNFTGVLLSGEEGNDLPAIKEIVPGEDLSFLL